MTATIDHVGVYAADTGAMKDQLTYQLGQQLTWWLDTEGVDNWWLGWGSDVTLHVMPWLYPHEVEYQRTFGTVINHVAVHMPDIDPYCEQLDALGLELLYREVHADQQLALYLGRSNEILELIAMEPSIIDPPSPGTLADQSVLRPQWVNVVCEEVDATVAVWTDALEMAIVGRSASGATAYVADQRLDDEAHAFVIRFVGRNDWNERERAWFDEKGSGMQALCYTAADVGSAFDAAASRGMPVGERFEDGTGWFVDDDGHELRVDNRLPFDAMIAAAASGVPTIV